MEWRESDPSEDEPQQTDSQKARASTSRKRSSRACDQCRKTKSKCERNPADAAKCKSCLLTGAVCTYLGPSYKRGPPKGYIHAIEQRWHQVEALLGAILQCPDERVQNLVADLKQDDLAREILGRVDSGPYGPSGRRSQPVDATKEDFFASILKSSESAGGDDSRSRRQSRVSREIVSSNQDHGLSVVPTKEWQDNLSKRLTFDSSRSRGGSTPDGEPALQRRRLNNGHVPPASWSNMYTFENDDDEDFKSATDALGQLSLDENSEVRFHGRASGLHILGSNPRKDDRIEGGIWRLPMARVWPPSKFGYQTYPLTQLSDDLPSQSIQKEFIDLYFTYIHPIFPVLHKTRFLSEYAARTSGEAKDSPGQSSAGSTYSSPRPEPTQEVTPLLLFAMFALTARYTETDMPKPRDRQMWEAGCDYMEKARSLLSKVSHISRPSTVQAILLLGYREFGIGSMEQGWLFMGTAIRMAQDLGLHCDSTKWKMHGHDIFSPEETQTRRQIWWACVLCDRYGAFWMGRPLMIRDEDFETPLPNVDPGEDRKMWQPSLTKDNIPYAPAPCRTMSVFCATARLVVIMGNIVTQIYPINPAPGSSKVAALATLESRLDQWYITLPEELRYDASTKRYIPSPQILFLHVRYWGVVILLHRAFIPNWRRNEETKQKSVGTRALDLAHTAAVHLGSIGMLYRDTFTMERASPFFTAYLLAAAILHLLMLTIRPDNIEANAGLQNTMACLKDMGVVWPSALRAWDLLNGVQLRAHAQAPYSAPYQYTDRNKRAAQDAFADEKAEYLTRETVYDSSGVPENGQEGGVLGDVSGNGVQDMSTRLMAHMLGLGAQGPEGSAANYGGFQQAWPRTGTTTGYGQQVPYPANGSYGSNISAINPGGLTGPTPEEGGQWVGDAGTYGMNNINYGYNFGQYGQ